jgi:hypothetical protein
MANSVPTTISHHGASGGKARAISQAVTTALPSLRNRRSGLPRSRASALRRPARRAWRSPAAGGCSDRSARRRRQFPAAARQHLQHHAPHAASAEQIRRRREGSSFAARGRRAVPAARARLRCRRSAARRASMAAISRCCSAAQLVGVSRLRRLALGAAHVPSPRRWSPSCASASTAPLPPARGIDGRGRRCRPDRCARHWRRGFFSAASWRLPPCARRSAFSACSRSARALRSSKRALAASAACFSRSRAQISLLAKRKVLHQRNVRRADVAAAAAFDAVEEVILLRLAEVPGAREPVQLERLQLVRTDFGTGAATDARHFRRLGGKQRRRTGDDAVGRLDHRRVEVGISKPIIGPPIRIAAGVGFRSAEGDQVAQRRAEPTLPSCAAARRCRSA